MKGHKEHHHMKHKGKAHKTTGGVVDKDPAPHEVYEGAGSHVVHEAEEKKHGGRTKRKHGGHVMHHHSGHVKHVGMHGAHAKHHAGRKPRKSGGSVESNPFSHARHGSEPKGHKVQQEWE
jgi:hypothetical protein